MKQHDGWLSGAPYDAYMGRLSRLVAKAFVPWLQVAPGGRWLDVGCGTGALSEAVLRDAEPARVTGVDRARPFAAYAREQTRDWRAQFEVGDAVALPFADRAFAAVVSGLALNFMPEPAKAADEMARVADEGGIVAAYVWDYGEGMGPLRTFWAAAVEVDPAAAALDEGPRFPMCRPEPLRDLFKAARLSAVTVIPIDVEPGYRDFEDFWQPFLGGTGPAPRYLSSLGEEQRLAVRDRVRSRLPILLDGSFTLRARAWAVRGEQRR